MRLKIAVSVVRFRPWAPLNQTLRRTRFRWLDTFVAALDTYVRVLLPSGSNFFRTPQTTGRFHHGQNVQPRPESAAKLSGAIRASQFAGIHRQAMGSGGGREIGRLGARAGGGI